jgi:hypothetical protein
LVDCKGTRPTNGSFKIGGTGTTLLGVILAVSLLIVSSTVLLVAGETLSAGAASSSTIVGTPAPPASRAPSSFPSLTYGNASFVLPDWNPLAPYAFSGNGANQLFGAENQTPLLSWSADGVFYVNQTDQLVFFNFATESVTWISAWTPLYQNLMDYQGIENTEWITGDGSFVYTFGCLSLCAPNSSLTLYAVNVSTGQSFEHTYTGVEVKDGTVTTQSNAQINLIGYNGSSDLAVLVASDGKMLAWSLANGTQWTLYDLPYFEANNLYWVPELNSYVNVEAGGSIADNWQQLRFNGQALTQVAHGSWGSTVQGNYVLGLVYNVTAHRIYTDAGYVHASTDEHFYWPVANGILGPTVGVLMNNMNWTNEVSSEHRIQSIAEGASFHSGWGCAVCVNGSDLPEDAFPYNPVTNTTYVTNEAIAPYGYFPSFDVEGMFYNSSYVISLYSTDCQETNCSIAQSDGSVYWIYAVNQGEFPFAPDAPIAVPDPPSAPRLTGLTSTPTTITLTWNQPDVRDLPLINYTLFYGTSGSSGYSHAVSLLPEERAFTATGLTPGSTYDFDLVPLNQHYFGSGLVFSAAAESMPAYPVTFQRTGISYTTPWEFWMNSTSGGPSFYNQGTGTSLVAVAVNGPYTYTAAATGYSEASGVVTVSGAPVVVNVTFTRVYSVGFVESGLPTGTRWSVTLNGTISGSTGLSLGFIEPNGSYLFTVGSVAGYAPNPLTGTASVNGAADTVTITFTAILPGTYPVVFTESGLPLGIRWSVTLNGTLQASNGPSIEFVEPSGNYTYSVGAPVGYSATPNPGTAAVQGKNASVTIRFVPASPSSGPTGWGILTGTVLGVPLYYWILGVGVIAGVGAFAILRSRRRTPPSPRDRTPSGKAD